jgi:hypothetical protein
MYTINMTRVTLKILYFSYAVIANLHENFRKIFSIIIIIIEFVAKFHML